MPDFFNEDVMNSKLSVFIPEGEHLIAGVKAIGDTMEVRQVFSYVTVQDEDTLCRSELQPDFMYDMQRCKYASHDIYIGITENYIVFKECDLYKHAYFANEAKPGEFEPMEVIDTVKLRDFGHAQENKNVIFVKVKKGLFGQYKCQVKFSNGSNFQFTIPKKAGVGNGMLHHAENRDKIIEKLNSLSK